ncbi:27 kDa hemolymph protein-like [Adelges cooleyi]|uniref:27 kDa hemolymph protein-like n=1 Tax=Adelges cooleyi TaxID=133065 RepID=UPI00217F8962|nr:27 kDa hemolymph protein-like [Adelges cooleyi]
MKNFVVPVIVVVLVISNNVNWCVRGSEGETDLNDLKDTVKKKFGSLSLDNVPNIDQLNSSIPSLEEGEKLFKEKCLRNSQVNNSYELAMEAKEQLQVCVHSLVDLKELKKEVEEAKPKGDVDIVFKKYCKKSPDFKSCVLNFTSTVEVCLDEGEKASKVILQSVTEALLGFVCHDEGDRIALFYSEGGPDCLMDKQEAIQHCLNTSFSKYSPSGDVNSLSNLPAFKFEEDQCKSMGELQTCVVAELTKCGEPTPANIVDSLFEFIRRSTPCSQYKSAQIQKSSSSSVNLLSSNSLTLFSGLIFLLGLVGYY